MKATWSQFPKSLLVATILMAACSILYELIMAKAIANLAGNGVMWESITIGAYVGALGLGAYVSRFWPESKALPSLMRVELALGLVGAVAVPSIYLLHILYRTYLFDGGLLREVLLVRPVIWFGLAAECLAMAVGFLSGMEVPLLLAIVPKQELKNPYPTLLGLSYFGTLIGTLIFAFFIGFESNLVMAASATAAVNLLVLIPLASFNGALPHHLLVMIGSGVSILGFLCTFAEPLLRFNTANFYYNMHSWYMDEQGLMSFEQTQAPRAFLEAMKTLPPIKTVRTKFQTIDVVQNDPRGPGHSSGSKEQGFAVHLDRNFQFSSRMERNYHEHLAHIPPLLNHSLPRRILVLGGGDGLLLRELLRYGRHVDSITLVDIDEGMVNLSRTDPQISSLNQGSLDNPKVKVVILDAFVYLRDELNMYDAIYIDLPYPFSYESSRLYSVEFLRMVEKRLNPGGFMAIDGPFDFDSSKDSEINHIAFNTIYSAGFHAVIAYQGGVETFLTASRQLGSIEFSDMDRKIKEGYIGGLLVKDLKWRMFNKSDPDERYVNSILRPASVLISSPHF